MTWFYQPAAPAAANGGLADVVATLSLTDSADSVTAVATVAVVATFSKTDSADTFSATATNGPEAAFSVTDSADSFSSTGTMGAITAVFSKTDTADTLVFDGTDGTSSGGLVFRAGVGRNFGGMFVIEPGTGTNEQTPGQAGAIPFRFGRFGGGLVIITPAAPTNPGPPDETFNAGNAVGGIGFGLSNTATSSRTGFFSMVAGVGNLSTIDTTDRTADQGDFGIGFGWSNTGKGVYSFSAVNGIGFGGSNAVSVADNNTFAIGQTNGSIGFGAENASIFVTSSTEADGDVLIGWSNTVSTFTTGDIAIQEALAALNVEDGETLRETLRLIRAATVGRGVHGAVVEYYSKDGTKVRITSDVSNGNRDVTSTDAT